MTLNNYGVGALGGVVLIDPDTGLPYKAEGGGSDPVAWGDVTDKPAVIAAGATQAAARTAIGAGTSSLALGTTASTALAGNTVIPAAATWANISGKPAVVASGTTAATARASIGAGTSNLALGIATGTAADAGALALELIDIDGRISDLATRVQALEDAAGGA